MACEALIADLPLINAEAETAREQEFYSYYDPFCQLAYENEQRNAGSALPNTSHSPDTALAAFAQLGALRLNCRRGIISFFDRRNQYVLAEATRTLSLHTGQVIDEADTLWLGPGVYARGNSVCEHTADPSLEFEQSEILHGPKVKVISDLTLHDRFKHKSFVKGSPNGRFYAGVPILTAKGYAIGAYCVLDENPRETVLPWEVALLQEMSLTIMAHLEMVRAKAENQRSQRMIQGLGSFMEGRSSLRDWWATSRTRPHMNRDIPSETTLPGFDQNHHSKLSTSINAANEAVAATNNATHDSFQPGLKHQPSTTSLSDGTSSPIDLRKLQEESLSSNVKTMFDRAVSILREAVNVDGALFLDASIGSFAGLVDSSSTGSHDPSTVSYQAQLNDGLTSEKTALVLGSSQAEGAASWTAALSETFLQSLLQRYPRGKTWTFSDHDDAVTGLEPTSIDSTRAEANVSQALRSIAQVNRIGRRAKEREMLRLLFPGVRYLALVGLWDSHRDRWFAASIIWTLSPTRIFSTDFELPYLATFGDSIMAEVARLDFNMAEKAKTDLLSSISHELRSPLHGILGCTEVLQDSTNDPSQESLLHIIESCGKALLDTVDHLLEHAKINRPSRNGRPNDSSSDNIQSGRSSRQGSVDSSSASSVANRWPNIDVDLALLAEEVIETACDGHDHEFVTRVDKAAGDLEIVEPAVRFVQGSIRRSRSDSKNGAKANGGGRKGDPVKLMLDLEGGLDGSWVFQTHPGAWRRLLMNLVSNSLKYTTKGFVRVRMEVLPAAETQEKESRSVILTVIDSGKGMETDFLRSQLFTPFTKEDPLTPGTGLGMSLIRDIVKKLGGTITVDSAKGKGTEVKVTIHKMMIAGEGGRTVEQEDFNAVAKQCSGMTMNFFGLREAASSMPQADNRRHPDQTDARFQESVHALCTGWFKLQTSFSPNPQNADFFLTTAQALRDVIALRSTSLTHRELSFMADKPLIILCDTAATLRAMGDRQVGRSISRNTQYIIQPCGPRKLMRALLNCLGMTPTQERTQRPEQFVLSEIKGTRRSMAMRTKTEDAEIAQATSSLTADTDILQRPGSEAIPLQPQNDPSDPVPSSQSRSESPHRPALQSISSIFNTEERTSTIKSASVPVLDSVASSGLSLLLVDDNPINLQLLVTFARKHKHKYSTATNGLEAFEVYKTMTDKLTSPADGSTMKQSFDFVLMDISMPIMDGLESTRRIRAFEQASGIRPANIVALTALASAGAQQEAYSSGVDLFYTKPVRLKELTEILKKEGLSRKNMSPILG